MKNKAFSQVLFFWVVLCVFGVGGEVLADSVVTAPSVVQGETEKALFFGQSLLWVAGLDPADAKKETRCLLMGAIGGRAVVADPEQREGSSKDALFFVDILAGEKAVFSGLEQDRIRVKGKPLRDLISHETKFGHVYGELLRGQLQEWPRAVGAAGREFRVVFFTNCVGGGIGGGIWAFRMVEDRSRGEKLLGLEALRPIVLPGKYSDFRVNSLDVIDLSSFSVSGENAGLPAALVVACKPPQGWDGEHRRLFLANPTHILSCSVTDDLSVTLNSEWENPDKQVTNDSWHEWFHRRHEYPLKALVGGGIAAPGGDGKLRYYIAWQKLEGWHIRGKASRMKVHRKIFSAPLVFGSPTAGYEVPYGALGLGEFSESWMDIGKDNERSEMKEEKTEGELLHKLLLRNPGPQMFVEGGGETPAKVCVRSSDNTLPPTLEERSGSGEIGEIAEANERTLAEINKKLVIVPGAEEYFSGASEEARVRRAAYVGGQRILAVFLGMPYAAVQARTNPDKTDVGKTSFVPTETLAHMDLHGYSNGFSGSLEVGGENRVKTSAWSGSKLSFKTSHDAAWGGTDTTKYAVSYSSSYGKSADVTTEKFFERGAVLYAKIRPEIRRLYQIVPAAASAEAGLAVEGAPLGSRFQYAGAFAQPSAEGKIIRAPAYSRFLLADTARSPNPQEWADEGGSFTSDFNPLSEGLGAMSEEGKSAVVPSTLIVFDNGKDFVRELEELHGEGEKNGVEDALRFAGMAGSGVEFLRSAEHSGGSFAYSLDSVSNTFDFSRLATNLSTVSYSQSETVAWQVNFGLDRVFGFFAKGELSYKGSQTWSYSDDKSSSFRFMIYGADSAQPQTAYLYSLFVDVPALKSYMLTHGYRLGGHDYGDGVARRPGFVPFYAWMHDQSFQLFVPWIDGEIRVQHPLAK